MNTTAQRSSRPPQPDASLLHDRHDLHDLLDAGLRFGPEYGGGLANHLPMLLHALHSIGASPARMREFAETYAVRLVPAEAAPQMRSPWPSGLGRRSMYADLRAHFDALIARDGMAAALSSVLPTLMPGVAAAAFHGLLRTAHGVAAAHAGEVAAGLAFWAATHLPLTPPRAESTGTAGPLGQRGVAEWATTLLALPPPPDAQAPLIAQRMAAWARSAGFAEAAEGLHVDPARPGDTLDALARSAAGLYATTGNFTVLHVVTSCQALRVLAPWQADLSAAVGHYVVAVAAGLCAARLAPGAGATTAAGPRLPRARRRHRRRRLPPGRCPCRAGAEPRSCPMSARPTPAAGAPALDRIDHVHVFVADLGAALGWYERVLGLTRVPQLAHWATDGGPCVVADADAKVHIALFERPPARHCSTLAFGVSEPAFGQWRVHLESQLGTEPPFEDHGESWSLYFADLDGNPFEITWDRQRVP